MAQALDFFGMFDYREGDGATYEYDSAEWANLIKVLTSNGVSTGSFEMTASGLDITVSAGTGVIQGHYGYNLNSTSVAIEPVVSKRRYDRVVLELNIDDRNITIKTISGEESANPTAPSLTQTDDIYQIPLYLVLVNTNNALTLTDERVITYNPTEIMAQFNTIVAEFNKIKNGTTTVYAVYA